MQGRKIRTNRPLLIFTVLLCLICGALIPRSSPTTESRDSEGQPDIFVAPTTEESIENTSSEAETPTAAPTATPVPEPTAAAIEASAEASVGVWTSNGSSWCFMVNGSAMTGWLTDTDGKRYHFDENGIMQTGWLDDNGNRYYLDADGVMQTGDVTVDGQNYHFREDGVLEGTAEETENAGTQALFSYTPTASDQAEAAAAESSSTQENTSEQTLQSEQTDTSADTSQTQASAAPTAAAEVVPGSSGKIALTFDDGPSDYTAGLLDCLEENQAKATFFLVGNMIDYYSEDVVRMESLGCEIGNHSYDHTDLSTLSAEEISNEIAKTDDLLVNLVGHGATVVRPPYGNVNDTVKSVISTPMILWTIDPEDWNEGEDVDRLVNAVMENVQDGSIVLMHDIFQSSVDAAKTLIPKLQAAGYELVTIHELAQARDISLEGGVVYDGF